MCRNHVLCPATLLSVVPSVSRDGSLGLLSLTFSGVETLPLITIQGDIWGRELRAEAACCEQKWMTTAQLALQAGCLSISGSSLRAGRREEERGFYSQISVSSTLLTHCPVSRGLGSSENEFCTLGAAGYALGSLANIKSLTLRGRVGGPSCKLSSSWWLPGQECGEGTEAS